MDPALQKLIDVQEIKDVHLRYCRGIDRADYDLVRECYHPDAIDDHGPYVGDVEGFIEWARERHRNVESTTHFTGNQLVEVDGEVAWAEHYARAYHRTPADGDTPAMDWVLNLRYADRMERRDGQWRIAHRILACESQRSDVVVGDQTLRPPWHRGTRDKSDPTYARELA